MLAKLAKICTLFALGVPGGLALAAPGAGYWHTSGSKILDSNNQAVRIAGINWYGFETTDEVVHGLNVQDYKTILEAIQANGYNTVRLPYSNQMVETPIVPSDISYSNSSGPINTDLQGLNSLQIMDAVIDYAGSIGLRVILDNHRSEAGNSAEASGLWYTGAYPESSWISDWQALATRYMNNSTVIGVDLRNEPHNASSGGACWDCGGADDWHLAAERGGNAVLAINPHLLIFVEGTDEYNNNFYFWGGNLQGVQNSPVQLNVANQLVYSAHDYGPAESSQAWFNGSTTYDSLVSTWTSYWAYISLNGIAPVWVGEFGTLNDDADLQSTTPGSQGQWFSSLVQFLGANPNLSWTYWALNGEDRYALLDSNYDATPLSAQKQQMLAQLQFQLSGGTPITTPSFTLAQSPSTVIAASSNTDLGSSGNTTEVTYTGLVNNRTSSSESNVSLTLSLPSAAVVISETSTGAAATCSSGNGGYTCSFSSIAASASGGVTITAIYPAANLTFNSSGQAMETVNASASAGSQALPSASVITTVDKQGQQQNATESIVATPLPGYSFNYGQQATVNFDLSPAPTSPIPLSSFSAKLDGSQSLSITSLGSNQYQIPVGLLSPGSHSISIQLAASSSYAAASAMVTLTVQKAFATLSVVGAPLAGNYGTAIPITLSVSGVSGTGFTSPTGNVSLVIDSLPPTTSPVSNGTAGFMAPAGLSATTHFLNFSYPGDSTYAPQTLTATVQIKQGQLVATAAPATRPFGAPNPTFTGSLTGVVNNDGITATYVSQATATTAAGTYSTGPNAIVPVLADPNNRLSNYAVTLNDGTLTIQGTSPDITWLTPGSITYGTPLTAAQLDASSTTPGTFVYKPAAGSVLNAGMQTLTVTFTPTGSAPQTAQTILVVNQATTNTVLTAVNATTAGSVTLSAVVNGENGGSLTGSVQFLDGSTSIASVTVNSTGLATYSVQLSNGPHTLTAVYSGDANNLGSTSTALLESVNGGLDFSLSANPKSLTLAAGQSMPVQLSVFSTDGFTGTVTFKCTGLPNGSTCTFSPASITGNASSVAQTTTLTIGLPAGTSSAVRGAGDGRYLAGFFVLPGSLLGFCLLRQRRRLQRTLGMWILATVFLVSAGIGCGAGSSVSPGGNTASSVGSYNALITATSPATVQTLTIPVTLTQ
ncbi:MAG TPA: cellulase family glycosylhydrolase [Acidobacteriaceae bacterium]|nr:cellulase family glycosylhydrolase [Acidobacteriaceae bacterium]